MLSDKDTDHALISKLLSRRDTGDIAIQGPMRLRKTGSREVKAGCVINLWQHTGARTFQCFSTDTTAD
jgi:hypothetical protein